ncbi:hypothetical protein ACJX0J_017895, partial [Zea mays]
MEFIALVVENKFMELEHTEKIKMISSGGSLRKPPLEIIELGKHNPLGQAGHARAKLIRRSKFMQILHLLGSWHKENCFLGWAGHGVLHYQVITGKQQENAATSHILTQEGEEHHIPAEQNKKKH